MCRQHHNNRGVQSIVDSTVLFEASGVAANRSSATRKFGLKLRALRLEREMSQEQLAEAAGMSRDAIARLELGGRWPRLDTVLRLRDALGASFEDFEAPATTSATRDRLDRATVGLDEADLQLLIGFAGLLRKRSS